MCLPPVFVGVGRTCFGYLHGRGLFDREKGNRVNRKVRNVLRGVLQRYGTVSMKEGLWDREFETGEWACLESMLGDCLYSYVEKYARGGSILDLGCGPGATGNEIQAESYSFYTGVDISKVAIERSRGKSQLTDRSAKNEYIQADIYSYAPERSYDVIVLGDSLYYVPEAGHKAMLLRYSGFLNAGGVFVVRLKGNRPSIPALIEQTFKVIEKKPHEDGAWMFVFRPR